MGDDNRKLNRRDFIKTAGGLGLASVLGAKTFGEPNTPAADANSKGGEKVKHPQVPLRKLGKTGVEVSILSLGGMFPIPENQIMLKRAIDWGVTYWDTAHGYMNGNSELGIGKYFAKNPEVRKEIFLVTKTSGAKDVAAMEKYLQTSLERMQTKYVDLLFWHGVSSPDQLTPEVKAFAESAKKRGLIKFYGFSTHENMATCLSAAAKMDWIDVIMTTYNFREMQKPEMNAAVDACHKAGIGLVAMKTQAKGPVEEKGKNPLSQFVQKGFTEQQAKMKAVWQDERFASICSQMPSVAVLVSNVAAALDKTKLTQADMEVFKQYAATTCDGYCAGCSAICQGALGEVPVRDVMRYVMYHDSYGMTEMAKEEFARIDSATRSRLLEIDYSKAQALCPHKLPIGEIMQDAVTKLA